MTAAYNCVKISGGCDFSKFSNKLFRFAAVMAVSLAATSAFAGRWWVGAADGNALFSTEANWAKERNGAGGYTKPGDGGTSTTYFYKYYNGRIVFDELSPLLPGNVLVGTRTNEYFVWSATDPAHGLFATNREIHVGSKINGACSPANLQIDSGTYNFKYARIGNESGGIANLLINGGDFVCTKAYVGATGHADGTLTVKGGTFKTSSTSTSDSLAIGCATNSTGTVVVDGGTLVNVGYASLGYVSNVTALVNVKSGRWIASGVHLGSMANKATNYIDHAVSRIVVDGGTVSWTNVNHSCLGNAIGEGSYAEMIVNGGDVTCAATYFYVADTGPATFTMNGGTFTMTHSSGIMNLGHMKTGHDVGTLVLNGGELAVRKLRLDYSQPGTKIVFNGGILKPITGASDFIDANANVTCEVQAGGMVIDTAGYNVTIKHDIVLADGVTSAPLIKKGKGTLTLSGTTPFSEDDIFVYEGTAQVSGAAYGPNVGTVIDASAGGDLGKVVIHGETLETWLKDPDYFTPYSSKYRAAGTNSLEQPLTIILSANGALKRYANLETGKEYSGSVGGVSYTFTTENLPPRTIQAVAPNGNLIKNIRDVGSWPLASADGTAKMNQGRIFRGAKLDDFANATEAQKAASSLADLKTEIDLRTIGVDSVDAAYQGATKSWAAVDADYIYCPINYNNGGSQIDSDDNGNFTNQVRRMFSRLGTSGALPAYFHCAIGTDRTGITGLLLLGLMGVEEETLYRDYLMSNFANIGSSRTPSVPEKFIRYMLRGDCNSNKYVYRDNSYGATVAGRARAYLEMCGVTTEEIANITKALSGETPDEVLARVNAYEAAKNVRTVTYIAYKGSTTTNAMHRLPAGEHILPFAAPTSRTGYVFVGWDTENEADGIVYGKWEYLVPNYWSSSNGDSESFMRAESWNPALEGGVFDQDATLVLNAGNNKTALLSEGSASVQTLYVGWGSLDGGRSSSTSNDHGGRLDVTGGTLNVTNILYIGGYRSPYSNIVNVTSGSLVVGALRMGDYYDSKSNGKWDVLNISGNGVVSNTTGEVQTSIRSSGSRSRIDISGNGSFVSAKDVKFGTTAASKSVVALSENASMDISGKSMYLAYGSGASAELSIDGSSTLSGVYDMTISYESSSTGKVTVAGNGGLSSTHYIYLGRKGEGELTIDGGTVLADSTVQFGHDSANGNSAVLNLNGGKLVTRQLKALGSPNAVINWNGGTLECSTYSYADGNMIPANDKLQINVLEGGAIYNAVVLNNEEIKHDMSGVGALTKRGAKALTVSGAANLEGGYIVEAGKLTLTNLTGTEFKKISVADGAELDLNGAEVTVDSYVLGGVKQRGGTYTEGVNGTIHVKVSNGARLSIK